MNFTTLAIIYTWKCNAKCASCCYSCGPKRQEKLPLETALSIIREAALIPEFKHLSITGGESLIYLEEVKTILKQWKETGNTSNIVTNAFWATTNKKALKLMKELKKCGLTTLSISCDTYHQEYIPIERVENALHAASDIGINIEINSIRGNNDPQLTELLPEIADIKKGDGVFQEGMLAPSGRASSLPQNKFTYLNSLPIERCGMLNTLTVTPGGKVYPCCSIFGETEHLSIGNINATPLKEILEETENNSLLLIMERQGFGMLLDLGKKIDKSIPIPSNVVNSCQLCHELFSNENCANAILQGVEQFEIEFYKQHLPQQNVIFKHS